MKTTLFLILSFAVLIVSAQSKFHLGIRGGLNYVNHIYQIDGIDNNGNEYRTGHHIGILSKFRIFDRFYLTPEISWNNRGYYNAGIDQNGNLNNSVILANFREESNTHFNYISTPLVLEFRPISAIGIELGSELSYMVSAKAKLETGTVELLQSWNGTELIQDKNRFDIGLIGGINIRIIEKLSIGGRYVHGISSLFDRVFLSSIVDGEVAVTNQETKSQNRTFQLSVSYFVF